MIQYLTSAIESSNPWMSDIELIKKGEGLELCTYNDTMGKKTVCYGYNLEKYGAKY